MSDLWMRFVADVVVNRIPLVREIAPRDTIRWRELLTTFSPGTTLELAIRKAVAKRSVPQFSILNANARQIAEHTGHSIEEVKAQALISCFGDEKLRKFVVLGRTIYLPISTNDLSKDEASKVIDWLVNTAEFLDLKLMSTDDYEVMK